MKNIFSSKLFVNVLNLIILFSLFIFLSYKLRYSYIMNDDLVDLLVGNFCFYHGRFFTESLSLFLVKFLPDFLNINVQDFAFISEGCFKSFIFVLLIGIVSKSFFHNKKLNILACVINLITFFTFFSMLFDLHFTSAFETLQVFNGYIFPLIFFILLWYKLLNCFLEPSVYLSKKDKIFSLLKIFVLSSLTAMGNEEISIVSIGLLFFLIIHEFIAKKEVQIEYVVAFISQLITGYFVYSAKGFISLWNGYNLNISFDFSMYELKSFLYIFYNEIVLNNLFLFVPIILFSICLLCKNDEKIKRTLKYVLMSYFSFLIFFFSLFFIGATNVYSPPPQYESLPKYWITYSALLMGFKIFLYMLAIFLAGQVYFYFANKKKYFLLFFLLLELSVYNFSNFEVISLSDYNSKRTMYIFDKLSVFYFRKNKTAILPRENIEKIMPISNDLMPIDLQTLAYQGKIYYKDRYSYLRYIQYVYSVNTSSGMMFKTYDEAIKNYIDNGGSIEDLTNKDIIFSKI